MDLPPDDRFHFDFAAGKALEDEGRFEASFQHYLQGNALRRAGIEYDAERKLTSKNEFPKGIARSFTRFNPTMSAHKKTGTPWRSRFHSRFPWLRK